MRIRSVLSILLVLVVATVAFPLAPASSEPTSERAAVTELTIVPAADGSLDVMVSGSGPDGALRRAADGSIPLAWDTTAIDPTAVRSDLVRLVIVDVEGPGTVRASAPGRHGSQVRVLDSSTGVATALQVGRVGELTWNADAPGRHVVEVEASIPLSPAGRAVGRATLQIDGGPAPAGAEAPTTTAPTPTAADGGEGLRSSSSTDPSIPAAVGGGASTPAATGEQVVISDGHVDMGPRIVDGDWRVQIKDDSTSPPTWRELADVVLAVPDAALIEVPDQEAFAFLGAPGTPYHLLPQAQSSGLVWPGWNTQDPSVVGAVPGSVTWTVRGVDGPGRFVVFATTSFGGTQVNFDSAEGFPQSMQIPRNVHAHANWAFGAPGLYRIQVEMAATLGSGASVSDTRTLVFAVGSGTDPSGGFGTDDGAGDPTGTAGAQGAGGSNPGGSGSGSGAGSGTGSLVRTGAETAPLVALGVGLVAVGAVIDLTIRRRRGAANP